MTRGLLQLAGVCVDLVYEIDALPERGGEAVARSAARHAGGGFNAMAAASRAGLPVAYGAGLGTGLFAEFVAAEIAALGAPVLLPRVTDADQGDCVVLVEPSGERSFVSHGGAEYRLSDETLASLDPAGWDWILASGYGLAAEGAAGALGRWIARLPPGAPLVFDPSPVVREIPADALEAALGRARWISLNRAEAAALAGSAPPDAMAAALLARRCPAAEGVVLRTGAEGCVLALRARAPAPIPGFAVTPLDTTGAGDAHVGVFLAALTAGETPARAARVANVAAALSTTARGPATAPDRPALDAALARAEAAASRPSPVPPTP